MKQMTGIERKWPARETNDRKISYRQGSGRSGEWNVEREMRGQEMVKYVRATEEERGGKFIPVSEQPRHERQMSDEGLQQQQR